MKNPIPLTLFILLLCSAGAHAQTSAELDRKYQPITNYEVRPGILMTAQYGADGQVCRMTVEPERASKDVINLEVSVNDDLVNAFVDEIAPPEVRGKPGKHDGMTFRAGQVAITIKDYEYITIERYSIMRNASGAQKLEPWVVSVTWKQRTCRP